MKPKCRFLCLCLKCQLPALFPRNRLFLSFLRLLPQVLIVYLTARFIVGRSATETAADKTGSPEGGPRPLQPAGEPETDHVANRRLGGRRPFQSLPAAAQCRHQTVAYQGHVHQK